LGNSFPIFELVESNVTSSGENVLTKPIFKSASTSLDAIACRLIYVSDTLESSLSFNRRWWKRR